MDHSSTPPSDSTPSRKPRLVRVRKPEHPLAQAREAKNQEKKSGLPHDSLGWSLVLAAKTLSKVKQGKSLTEALESLSKEAQVAKSSAQDIVYGVLRTHGQGEYILSKLMTKPLTHEETFCLLLAALYRLKTRQDSAPMIVDQSVIAAGEISGNVFKGLVNGVLRNYLRQRDALLLAMSSDEEAHYAFPRWWINRLRRNYPEKWQSIVAASNTQPPMTLRVNLKKTSLVDYQKLLEEAGIEARVVNSSGLILKKAIAVDALPGFFQGLVSVQDIGAQRAATLLAPSDGLRILDACAAPGGKTSHLLEMANADLVALDIDALRVKRIEENLKRLGLSAQTKTANCTELDQWWDGKPFDAILADVPCSASGVIKRHPDIKLLRRESDILRFAKKQAAILDTLWKTLKPGGRLLYVTCSIFPEENTAQIDAFLARKLDAIKLIEEQWLPQEDNDGFYYALLRKAN